MDSVCMDTSDNTSNMMSSETKLPAWRMPISTSFSPSLRERLSRISSAQSKSSASNHVTCPADLLLGSPSATSSVEENEMQHHVNNINNRRTSDYSNSNNNIISNEDDNDVSRDNDFETNENRPAVSRRSSNRSEGQDEEDSQTVIQILLPCIVCNRTFSPEALERHAKVCTKVNTKSPYKPTRGTFDTAETRKKGTRLEHFIPPPQTFDALTDNRIGFSRGSRNRTSLRGTSCTTRTTLNLNSASANARRDRSVSQSRERSSSTSRNIAPPPPPSTSANSQNEYPYDDTSEFGSNNSEENSPANLPSYAKPIAPTDTCPYCNRNFGIKSFDRHVEFCKEIYERKRYEIQPVPKEKEEALERQEIRTKYRPMKGSTSCTSLRSMSPGKDFASMAMKLFGGLRRTEGTANLYFNQIKNNLKKSNESIANSCYGDYTRGMRRTSPSPVRASAASAANKLNNLLTKSYLHQQHQQQQQHHHQFGYPQQQGSMLPMRINTSANIPKLTKSTDSLAGGHTYAHVQSSGYGQPPAILMMNTNNNNNFSRNSRSRSSLHKNFFRTKRAEPDGTENTSTLSQSPTGTSPLIITPVNFFSKGNKTSSSSALDLSETGQRMTKGLSPMTTAAELQGMMLTENGRPGGASLLTSDPDYDPYEKAAKQLEELLKTSPVKTSKRTSRRTGLEKAFESVGVPSDLPSLGKLKLGRTQSLDYSSDPFGMYGGGRGSTRRNDPLLGLGGMSMTPNIDDSYWDQILRKGDNQHGNNNNSNNSNNQETVSSQEESDTSGASDTAKSRAMSNTSSADSAFSR